MVGLLVDIGAEINPHHTRIIAIDIISVPFYHNLILFRYTYRQCLGIKENTLMYDESS